MLHEKHRDWITARGLDAKLADQLGLTTTRDGGGYWLSIPYRERGSVLNHKHRLTTEKRHRMDSGAPLTLWNHDALLHPDVQSGKASILITEGEWDALAAIQCGFQHTVSVPNGAPAEPSENPADPTMHRYEFLRRAQPLLDNVGRFILATDNDPAGRALRQDLAVWLGAERCLFLTYPEGMKDLNEVLSAYGQSAVVETINEAKPYPVRGLYRLSEMPEPPAMEVISHGIPGLAELLPIVPGTLTVVTGYPSHGKSSLTLNVAANIMRSHRVCIASFETAAKPILQRRLRAALARCAESSLTREMCEGADEIIEAACSLIVNFDDEMTVAKLIETMWTAVRRDGCRFVLIDPWNEIEHKRERHELETDYTGVSLKAFRNFAKESNCAVWLVAHPSKPLMQGGKLEHPGLANISGSMHWANKPDYGLSIHHPNKDTDTREAHVVKVRMGFPGKKGTVRLNYDWRTSEYFEAEPERKGGAWADA